MKVGHQARKRFGQNFLQDASVISRIIGAVAPKPEQHLVEIGPGLGALTEPLLAQAGGLDIIELDRDLVPVLRTQFFRYEDSLRIYQADALKFDFSTLVSAESPAPLRVVGNLPYNISTPLIFHLLKFRRQIADMHFMLQKEVVLRLAAGPGDNNYGRLSVMAQYFCQVDNLFEVPPTAFSPQPKVDSAIVRLQPYSELPIAAANEQDFATLVRTGFSQRRKTLRNNLKKLLPVTAIEALNIDPGIRPERLSLAEFVKLSDAYTAFQASTPSEEV